MPALGLFAGQPALQAPDQAALDKAGIHPGFGVEQRLKRLEALGAPLDFVLDADILHVIAVALCQLEILRAARGHHDAPLPDLPRLMHDAVGCETDHAGEDADNRRLGVTGICHSPSPKSRSCIVPLIYAAILIIGRASRHRLLAAP